MPMPAVPTRGANKSDGIAPEQWRPFMSTQHKDWVAKAELDRYGIVTVPMKVFEWGGFRYTHARDALAAAKRSERS